jgi:mevalonate kinase
MLTVSAPGKLMLFGEHAVVYGFPCIVTAVDERLHVSIEPANQLHFEIPHIKDTRFLEAAVAAAQKRFGLPELSVKLTTRNDFSGIKGFGSSSAVCVATISAIAGYTNHEISKKELFDMAYEAVLSVQGVGSGFDVAAAVYGGTIEFVRGGQSINRLIDESITIPMVIGYTGIKVDTATIIKEVADMRKKNQKRIDGIFEEIGSLVRKASKQVKKCDWEEVGRLMDSNQKYLRDLGVSSEKLEALISAAKNAGAYGAKLSGSGRGDCMIALVSPHNRNAVGSAICSAGGIAIPASTNAPGVMIDTTDDQSELFVVVDRDDNVIGYRTRYDCHHDKSLIHRAITVLILDDQGRILLQKRSNTKDKLPGYWAFSAGGHVGKGESYEQAIHREMKEELGVDLPVSPYRTFVFTKEQESEMESLFLAKSNGPFSPDPREVADIMFFSKEELLQKLRSQEVMITPLTDYMLHMVGFLS